MIGSELLWRQWRSCFSIHLLLFQVIDSPEVHMLNGGGGAGGRGARRELDWVSLATGGTHLGRWLWRMQHAHLRWGAMPCGIFMLFCNFLCLLWCSTFPVSDLTEQVYQVKSFPGNKLVVLYLQLLLISGQLFVLVCFYELGFVYVI